MPELKSNSVETGNEAPLFPLAPDVAGSNPTLKVLNTLEEAFDAFDKYDDQPMVQFIFKPQTPTTSITRKDNDELVDYFLRNALLLIDSGEYELAVKILGDILRRNSHHSDAVRWMGWCFKQQEDLENARKCYEELLKIRATEQDLFELGEIYFGLKQDELAKETLIRALHSCSAESPRLFDIHKNLGNVFARLGDLDSAEENYNKALVLRPHSDSVQVNLGSIDFQRQSLNEAMSHFKDALELNAFNDRAWCGISLVAREKGDSEWAKSVLLKALDINPLNITALQILVNWSQIDEKWDAAIEKVQSYVEKNHTDCNMIYTLAGLHFQAGNYNQAEFELAKLLALDPNRADASELSCLIQAKRQEKG